MRRDADIGKFDGVFPGEAFIIDPGKILHGQRGLIQADGEVQFIELVVGPELVFGDGFFFYVLTRFGIAFEHREVTAFGQGRVVFCGRCGTGVTGREGCDDHEKDSGR